LIAFSTSGNSENIIQASISAKQKNMSVIGLIGGDGGRLKPLVAALPPLPQSKILWPEIRVLIISLDAAVISGV
jgi:D-sedoheptulose 7-phosphate isomerase